MEYTEVKEYLDRLVEIHEEASKYHHLNSQIKASLNADTVLIFSGIEIIADAMGLLLLEEIHADRETGLKYHYSFIYQNVKFVAYMRERLEGF